MDFTKSKPAFELKINPVSLIPILPGMFLTIYIFILALINIENITVSKDMWDTETNSYLISEFVKYRNFFYFIFILWMFYLGIVVIVKSVRKLLVKNSKYTVGQSKLISASVIGLITVTFAYAFAGVLVDLYLLIKRII